MKIIEAVAIKKPALGKRALASSVFFSLSETAIGSQFSDSMRVAIEHLR